MYKFSTRYFHFFRFRKILPLAILRLSPFSFLSLLLFYFTSPPTLPSRHSPRFAANFSQSHPRFPSSQPSAVTCSNFSFSSPPFSPRGIFLPVRLARIDVHFGHTNYCFVSYFAPRDAPLIARYPRCSCMQLPRGCNLRPRRTTRFGTRRNVTPAFCSRPRAAAPPLHSCYCSP